MAFGKTNFAMLLGSGPSKKFNMQSLFQDSPEWPKQYKYKDKLEYNNDNSLACMKHAN